MREDRPMSIDRQTFITFVNQHAGQCYCGRDLPDPTGYLVDVALAIRTGGAMVVDAEPPFDDTHQPADCPAVVRFGPGDGVDIREFSSMQMRFQNLVPVGLKNDAEHVVGHARVALGAPVEAAAAALLKQVSQVIGLEEAAQVYLAEARKLPAGSARRAAYDNALKAERDARVLGKTARASLNARADEWEMLEEQKRRLDLQGHRRTLQDGVSGRALEVTVSPPRVPRDEA